LARKEVEHVFEQQSLQGRHVPRRKPDVSCTGPDRFCDWAPMATVGKPVPLQVCRSVVSRFMCTPVAAPWCWYRLFRSSKAGRWAGSSPYSRNPNFVQRRSEDPAQKVITSDVRCAKRCYDGWFSPSSVPTLPVQHGGGHLPDCQRAWGMYPRDFTARRAQCGEPRCMNISR